MAGIIRKLVRKAKKRIREGLKDARTWALYEAGQRLLAQGDYEQISVAQIAREAGTSVGAFYQRFPDKNAFLSLVIHATFRNATDAANRDLQSNLWTKKPVEQRVEPIVHHLVARLGNARTIGVLRATIKLGTIKPSVLQPLFRYRTNLTDRAVELLSPLLTNNVSPLSVRTAMQIAFATVTDAALLNRNLLQGDAKRLKSTLRNLFSRYLELEGGDNAEHDLEVVNSDDEGERPEKSAAKLISEGKKKLKSREEPPTYNPDLRILREPSKGVMRGASRSAAGRSKPAKRNAEKVKIEMSNPKSTGKAILDTREPSAEAPKPSKRKIRKI